MPWQCSLLSGLRQHSPPEGQCCRSAETGTGQQKLPEAALPYGCGWLAGQLAQPVLLAGTSGGGGGAPPGPAGLCVANALPTEKAQACAHEAPSHESSGAWSGEMRRCCAPGDEEDLLVGLEERVDR